MRILLLIAVLVMPASALADIVFYTDPVAFEMAATNEGYVPFEFEDFEESTLSGGEMAFDDPLCPGVGNGPFPSGLTGVSDMCVQSNASGEFAPTANPRGTDGLRTYTAGHNGATSDVVLSNVNSDSTDLIFDIGAEKHGVGFNMLDFAGGAGLYIEVYGPGDTLLGEGGNFEADHTGSHFLGIVGTEEELIQRINIYSIFWGYEGADNIQTWVPEPSSLVLLAFSLVALRRR